MYIVASIYIPVCIHHYNISYMLYKSPLFYYMLCY